MTRGGLIRRRGFLIGGMAIAGGVAFGTFLIRRDHPNPLTDGLEAGEASFNPWVKITSERIVLITPHADVGQGVAHMQAALIAEEMDLEFGQFDTAFGQPAAAYYNTALVQESVPFRVTDKGAIADLARGIYEATGKVIGLQGTGGSTSVPDSFDKLRWAGATARETLKAAAAQRFGIEAGRLLTKSGAVVLPDGTKVPYQELADTAQDTPTMTPDALRPAKEWRLLGQEQHRLDVIAKSTGTQAYGIDQKQENMVHAAVRLSPTRAAAVRVDTTAAEQAAGVMKVLAIKDGFAVIARNTWTAMQAADLIDVTWAPADYPAEQKAHWEKLAQTIDAGEVDAEWRSDGDGRSFAEGQEISAEYAAPYVAHQPLEPLSATVLVDDNGLQIWASNQLPTMLKRLAAKIANVKTKQVTFHNQFAGGSFGHRLEFDYILQAVEVALTMPGTPVKLTYKREEDFARDFPRHIGLARCKGAVNKGRVTGLDMQIAGAAPIASQLDRMGFPLIGPDTQLPAGAWNAHYGLEDFRLRSYRAEGLAPVSSWRSVGASSNGFFLESFLDELITAAGADPLEERLRLCTWDVVRGVLEAVGDISNWGAPVKTGQGRGLAMVESFGVPVAQVIDVSQTDEGLRVDHVWVAADAGTVLDPINFESQIQGGVIWGLGHAINSEVTYSAGMAEQTNYHDAEGLRLYQTPEITVVWREANDPIKGIGEPPVPPVAPALANAIFRATGTRLREMPFNRFVDFV